MNGLAGSLVKLRNAEIPLPERVRVCRSILLSEDAFLPNKHQVLVDWLCHELNQFRSSGNLKHDGDVAFRAETVELWTMLSEILDNSLSEQIVLRQKVLPLFFEELEKIKRCIVESPIENILNSQAKSMAVFLCIQGMLRNPNMALTFFNRLENLEQSLKNVLGCFFGILTQSNLHCVNFGPTLAHLVCILLRQYLLTQKQLVSQHKVFTNFCERLLPILLLVRTITRDEGNFLAGLPDFSKEEMISKIDAVIISGLFHQDHVMSYKPTVIMVKLLEPIPKKQKQINIFDHLFDAFENVKRAGEENVCIDGICVGSVLALKTLSECLPFMLESFLEVTKDNGKLNKSQKFSFFVELCGVMTSTARADPAIRRPLELCQVKALNRMLEIIVLFDVYDISEDNMNDQPIFRWFLSFTENLLLAWGCNNAALFQCLNLVLKLNHKIIEHCLDNVLFQCFAKAEHCSKELNKSKDEFLGSLVETYTKLQQVDNLVRQIVSALKLLGHKLDEIPVRVNAELSKAFELCPLPVSLSIFQYFNSEMKGQIQLLEQEINFCGSALKAISVLFVLFLVSSSYNAANPHGLDEVRANTLKKLLKDLKNNIIIPLIKALPACQKNCQKQLGFASLYMIYGLNSLTSFFRQYDVLPDVESTYFNFLWDDEVAAFIPDLSWKGMKILTRSGCLRFCMDLLAVQRACFLLDNPDDNQNTLHHLVKFLFAFQDPHTDLQLASISWNFDPSCVTSKNYQVAHWSLVAQYAPLLIPYCTDNQVHSFVSICVRFLLLEKEENAPDHLITAYDISDRVLKADELIAMAPFQKAFVKQFWLLVDESMSDVVGDRLSHVFSWISMHSQEDKCSHRQELEEKSGEDNSSIKVDVGAVSLLSQEIVKMTTEGVRKISMECSKKKQSAAFFMVESQLKVLQSLPCHLLMLSNQVRCILGLLACDVLCEQIGQRGLTVAVQICCREILSNLLQGAIQYREFEAWQMMDVKGVLLWLYHTVLRPDETITEIPFTQDLSNFLQASKTLWRLLVVMSLKSRVASHLLAVCDFSEELVTTFNALLKTSGRELAECLDTMLLKVSACVEFLQQKAKGRSAVRSVCSIVQRTASAVVPFITEIIRNHGERSSERKAVVVPSDLEVEMFAMKLSGILTQAMGLISESELFKNDAWHDIVESWKEVVLMVLTKIMTKMENKSLNREWLESEELVAYVRIMKDMCNFGAGHCGADELRPRILGTGLEILRETGFPHVGVKNNKRREGSGEVCNLDEAVLGLFTAMLKEDAGKSFVRVLEGVLEWSIQGERNETSNLRTGLFVLKTLFASKTAKLSKKEFRPRAGTAMATLLSKAMTNIENFTVIMEIVGELFSLGNRALYPQDLAMVFQGLTLNYEVEDLEIFCRIFSARLRILNGLLHYYPDFVYGAIHVFSACLRELFGNFLKLAAQMGKGKTDARPVSILTSCGQKIPRLYQAMVSHKDVFSKYSLYFLADCFHSISTFGVPGYIREFVVQSVYFLFDLSSDDSLTKLHVYLPSAERELFRSFKEDYTKHHKFKGNA